MSQQESCMWGQKLTKRRKAIYLYLSILLVFQYIQFLSIINTNSLQITQNYNYGYNYSYNLPQSTQPQQLQPQIQQYNYQQPQQQPYQYNYQQPTPTPKSIQPGSSVQPTQPSNPQVESQSVQSKQSQYSSKSLISYQWSILYKNLRILQVLCYKKSSKASNKYDEDIEKYSKFIKQFMQENSITNDQLQQFLEERGCAKFFESSFKVIKSQNIDNSQILQKLCKFRDNLSTALLLLKSQSISAQQLLESFKFTLANYQSIINCSGCPSENWRGFAMLEDFINRLQQVDGQILYRDDLMLEDLEDLFDNDIKQNNWQTQN